MAILLEIAAFNLDSALLAERSGAMRIELCDNAADGGTTPGSGTLKVAREKIGIPVFPIIRPRGGHFVYSTSECDSMKYDIELCQNLGFPGVVFGALTPQGEVNLPAMQQLMQLCEGMEVTFHRAFDRTVHAEEAIEAIISLGCRRILTSGRVPTADEGMQAIAEWNFTYGNKILFMPGSGVNHTNIISILNTTGCHEIHTAARVLNSNGTYYNQPGMHESPSYTDVSMNEISILRESIRNL